MRVLFGGAGEMPNHTLIYHITHTSNLDSILAANGLYSCSYVHANNVGYTNIAHSNIQDRRARFPVPLPPFGFVHDYVPFYFAPRSPMLYAIAKGIVKGYTGGQSEVIYLVTSAERIHTANIPYVFTDGHAVVAFSEYYNSPHDLQHIDWDVMRSQYWRDTPQDNDRTRRRQAEFLAHNYVPLNLFGGIAVRNISQQTSVAQKLSRAGLSVPVNLQTDWYY
jgi:hypothetical protein